jgi:LL-diaminopimelate aminotransferase
MPLLEENRWLPNLAEIPDEVAFKAKVMWLNYPNNPTGALADLDYFKTVVDFAKSNNILVMHDACYTEVAYDGTRPHSFLEVPGAMDVSIEFHSLSKSYNMTGWRLGVAVGNSELINALMVVKSNLDSGVPQAIQMMGIDALNAPVESVDERNSVYQQRRDRLISALAKIGLHVDPPKASLYVWAQVPEGYSSAELTEILLEERNIVVTPGSGYGKYGEGYIRLSLTISDDQFEKGLGQLEGWIIPSKAS